MLQLILALFVVATLAEPTPAGEVININLKDQNHNQQGDAGEAVTGTYG